MEFPTVQQVAEQLRYAFLGIRWSDIEDDGDGRTVDVRLQVYLDGDWTIHTGSSDYDQDHRGFWGASCLSFEDTEERFRATAENLISQAQDDAAQDGQEIAS